MSFAEITQRQLLGDYAPASVLINRNYEVLYCFGTTGDFLETPAGEPTRDLIAMARHGLQTRLRAACHRAIRENKIIRDDTPRRGHHGAWYSCTITVKPITEPKQDEGLLLVTFHEHEVLPRENTDVQTQNQTPDESPLVSQLGYELKTTRENLQNTIEDMESSNEELKASNAELQSLNEELSTVNRQLQDKVENWTRHTAT
jgi:two-component system CheB/CheR fusion protein